MEEPLFAEVKDKIKEEEPWGDYPQTIQSNGVKGEEPEEKPNRNVLDENFAYLAPMYEETSESTCPPPLLVARPLDKRKKANYLMFSNETVRRRKKRPFHGEAEGAVKSGNLASGEGLPPKMSFSSSERAAGAQNAEDIMRQIDAEKGAIKQEIVEEEQTQLHEEQPAPFRGALPFAFKCPKCEAAFHLFEGLRGHVAHLHPGVEPLWCHLCPKKYAKVGTWSSHLKSVHGIEPLQDHPGGYKCDECEGHFRQREKYASHCQDVRGKFHVYCHFCKEGVLAINRQSHEKTVKHKMAKSRSGVSCEDCGKECLGSRGYQEHQKSLIKKPHAFCEPCRKIVDPDQWENHQETIGHQGVKMRFHCCKTVIRPEELEDHLMCRGHIEQTWVVRLPLKWKCYFGCGSLFSTTDNLAKHYSDHHPGLMLPFLCRHCHQQFGTRLNLSNHEELEQS